MELLQFVVPLAFLAIWALTSLLNRDTQPLPPRSGRVPGPGGGARPGASMEWGGSRSGRPDGFGMGRETAAGRGVSQGAGALGRPGAAGGRPLTANDSIVFLGPDGRAVAVPASSPSAFTPSASAGGRGGASARRAAARPKPRQNMSGLTSIEPERPRGLTGLAGQPLAGNKARSLQIAPLSTPIAPLSSPLTQDARTNAPDAPLAVSGQPRPALSSHDLRSMLSTPEKLREMAAISEVLLRPPVALRSRPPRRS